MARSRIFYILFAFVVALSQIVSVVNGRRADRRANLDAETTDADAEPSPDEILAKFSTVDFAAQPYAEQMLLGGREPMTDAQRVYMSKYTEGILKNAIDAVREHLDDPSALDDDDEQGEGGYRDHVLKILADVELSKAVLWSPEKWEHDMIPNMNKALHILEGHKSTYVTQLREVLKKVVESFWSEMHFPRSHYYLGMTDDSVWRYSRSDMRPMQVELQDLRAMHPLDTQASRDKSDKRGQKTFNFFERLYESGLAGKSKWFLSEMLKEHGTSSDKWALQSQTPMMCFELREGELGGPSFVLMEGNGRLGGLTTALDRMREAHPDFVAPHLEVNVIPFDGTAMERRNFLFFLRLNWRNQFPDLEINGWQRQVSDSVRDVSPEYADIIRSRPRYFGFYPAPHTWFDRSFPLAQTIVSAEPTPEEFIEQFTDVDFAAQPYAEHMILHGRDPMTDPQRVWMSKYTQGILEKAKAELSESLDDPDGAGSDGEDLSESDEMLPEAPILEKRPSGNRRGALDIVEKLKLNEAVLWSPEKWKADMIPQVKAAIGLLERHGRSSRAAVQLKDVLSKIVESFWSEMHFPRSHFYLGMTDGSVWRLAKHAPATRAVPLESLRAMHTLDTQEARDKSDKRRDVTVKFFKRIWDLGKAKPPSTWELSEMLDTLHDEDARWALHSQTNMQAFELKEGELGGPSFVLMEGNGRLGGLTAALDVIRKEHPSFVAPRITVDVIPFDGTEMERNNFLFFLSLNWRNQFPDLDVEGWQGQVSDSVRKVSKEYANVIRSRPRYFGYRPL